MTDAVAPVIDLEKIKSDIAGLTDDALKAELLKLRVREKKTQKKSYSSASAKAYQARAREKRKLMIALAREKGLMAEIDNQAEEIAEQELAEEKSAVDAASQEE